MPSELEESDYELICSQEKEKEVGGVSKAGKREKVKAAIKYFKFW